MKNRCNALAIFPELTLYHAGPALDHGPLPSFFYFAISGPDTLCLDPFNQPIQFLQHRMVRIFSMTLPGHEDGLLATNAMKLWAEDLSSGRDLISPFIDSILLAIEFAVKEKFVDPTQMVTGGLSRGAMIAAHLAAKEERFQKLLCFAPLTKLSKIKEFAHHTDLSLVNHFDLTHLAPKLGNRHVRIYIGNEDTRVGTKECFDFAMSLVSHKKQRSAQVELQIYPSIGQMGHGTPLEIFKQGVEWLFPS